MITTLPRDTLTGRPLVRGLPVPWIVRWTTEGTAGSLVLSLARGRDLFVRYAEDEASPFGPAADRDQLGLLWFRYTPGQDTGTPLFAQVHAGRQRDCMLERRCQVCGDPFSESEPVTFLLPNPGHHRPFTTLHPPCCPRCIPVAMRLCPEQRRVPRRLVRAHRYEPYSVAGTRYRVTADATRTEEACVGLGDREAIAMTVAKQLCVRVSEYSVEPL